MNLDYKRSNIKIDFVLFMLFLYYCLVIIRPTVNSFNIICIIIFTCWLMIAFLRQKQLISSIITKEIASLLVFLVFFFITAYLGSSLLNALKQSFFYALLFSPIILYRYTKIVYPKATIFRLLMWIIIMWVIMAIIACCFYATHYNAARRMASNLYFYGTVAIGAGYDFAYASAIFLTYIVGMKSSARKLLFQSKLCFITVFGVLVILVILTKSMITVLAMVLGCVYAYLLKKARKKQVILFIMVFVVFIVFYLFHRDIGMLILKLFSNSGDFFSSKISDIGEFLVGNDDNTMNTRFELIEYSLNTAIKNPIVGCGYQYGYQSVYQYDYGIGGHSEIIDSIAKYGILGVIPLFLVYFISFKKNVSTIKNIGNNAYIFTTLLIAMFNPLNQLFSGWVLFFIIPSISFCLSE